MIENTRRVLGERRLRTLRDLGAAAAEAKSTEEACAHRGGVLAGNRADVPFALFYLLEPRRAAARWSRRWRSARDAASPSIDPRGVDATGWPLASACCTRQIQIVTT